jgi:hypothetical protein
MWNRRQETIPRGLKPFVISAPPGTTEVVPFQNSPAMAFAYSGALSANAGSLTMTIPLRE